MSVSLTKMEFDEDSYCEVTYLMRGELSERQ